MQNQQVIDAIYQYVRDQILSGAYPENKKISERVIGERFNVSRTIVRSAFYELKKRGWLYTTSKSGTYVAPIDFEAVKENYEARLYTEASVLMMAYPHMEAADFQRMREACDVMEFGKREEYIFAETSLHDLLRRKTGNRYIMNFFDTMIESMLRAASRSSIESSRKKESSAQWRTIISSLEQGNPYMASQLLQAHMIESYNNFCKNYWGNTRPAGSDISEQ